MNGQRFALHCVGLQHFGEWEGLLAASGSGKSGCPSCFDDASEQGVSPRLEEGGGCQPDLRSLCALEVAGVFV